MQKRKWYLEQLTAPALMQRNAFQMGDETFQLYRDDEGKVVTLTYAESYNIIRELSCGLISMGFKKGDRAAIMCNTSPQWNWSDYAILSAGGITVCIYPTLSEHEIEFILSDSGAGIIFVEDGDILEKVLKICSRPKSKVKINHIVVMKSGSESNNKMVLDFSTLRKKGIELRKRDKMAFEERWRSVKLSDDMTIIYTSGTTGNPKGALQTHFGFTSANNRDCRVCNYAGPEQGDRFLSFLPMAHTYERQCGHGAAMQAGLSIAYSSPKTLVEDLKLFKPTIFMSVPRIYERVYMAMRDQAAKSPLKKKIFDAAIRTGIKVVENRADENGFINMAEGIDLTAGVNPWLKFKFRLFDKLIFSKVREAFGGRFRFAFSAAGSLDADLCKTFLAMGIRILEGYGATETLNEVTVNRLEKILPGSIGKLPTTDLEWRHAEDGEFLIKGDCIFKGYWNNEKATKEAFTEDGFYQTGDIVEVLADDYIKIVDRKKGLMVLDTGKNVPSQKIESLFSLSSYIEMLVPIGSERKFVSALIVPNFDSFINYFKENNISFDESELQFDTEMASTPVCIKVGPDFIEIPEFKKMINDEIEKVNMHLEFYEQVKKYHILDYKFTADTGELTPTLKVKRRIVLDKFEKEINQMYK